MFKIVFCPAGNVSRKQSALYALIEWANSNERKLLRLSCAQMLDRSRHREWAQERIRTAKFQMPHHKKYGYMVFE